MTASTTNKPAIALFGLGSMGYGMASSLLRAGLKTWGFDISEERESRFREEGGADGSRTDAVGTADIVVCVVVNAAQTEEILFGEDGVAEAMRPGTVFMSCATVSPEFARTAAQRLAERDVLYLDTPISGGAAKAATGELTIMGSGSPQAFDQAEPALDAMAAKVFRLGPEAGAGSAMKVVNQLLAGVHIAAAAEAVTFGLSQGIEPSKTLSVISECAGTSWMFENRVPHIVQGDYTPHSAVDIFVKDLGIVLDVARASGFSAPLSATALQQFVAAHGMGHGREDDSAVAKVYARNAGLTLPGED